MTAAKYQEIKWQGRAGQGVVTSAAVLAEILAKEGKYVQAFPEFIGQKQRPSILSFNRISGSPIKTHAGVDSADTVVVMDIRLLSGSDATVKRYARENASYIVNTSYNPDFIKEKLNLSDENRVFTLDADPAAVEALGSAIPNIPLMSVVVSIMNLLPLENFTRLLKESLSLRFEPDTVDANISLIQRALDEVKHYEP
jgi:2-oxoacid:acceptor oxidoreductase gamma subunit (pyruvate/2-ketoisovalerate family)